MAENPTETAGSPTSDGRALLADLRRRIDVALAEVLPPESEPPVGLHVAMRYSVLAGGKRLRPALVLAAGEACGATADEMMPAACAVELIHAYSLIHDDLPAFDDDSLRRGKPTSHVMFGEPQAILAGDALQSLAFSTMAHAARTSRDPRPWAAAIAELADAAGSMGMAGGQWLDVEAEGRDVDLPALETLHAAKTGALLTACARIGAILGHADGDTLERLSAYGRAVGLAFQVVDDILDVEGSVEELGKNPGGDAHRGKTTYPALLGLDEARATAQRLRRVAHDSVAPLGPAARPLALIADFIIDRKQ
jgi:geranylgeranyl diphosphate synthase type II